MSASRTYTNILNVRFYITLAILHMLFAAPCFAKNEIITIIQNMPSSTIAGTEFTVELRINKGDISGFAKIQQELPLGFTASSIETKSANFTFSDQILKFIWMTLPSESEFQISYEVSVSKEISGIINIGGAFVYLENNGRKIIDIKPVDIFVENQMLGITASDVPVQETTKLSDTVTNYDTFENNEIEEEIMGEEHSSTVIVNETPVNINTDISGTKSGTSVEDEIIPENNEINEIVSNEKPKTNFSATSPEITNIEYRIQISASYKKILNDYLINKYNIKEKINCEIHNGMNKYTVGSFPNYNSAKNHKDFIRNNRGIEEAFIVAYKGQKRITVQKAIELTKLR